MLAFVDFPEDGGVEADDLIWSNSLVGLAEEGLNNLVEGLLFWLRQPVSAVHQGCAQVILFRFGEKSDVRSKVVSH